MPPTPSPHRSGTPAADAAERPEADWHALPVAAVFERLGSGRDGLTSVEVAARQEIHGPNRLEDTARPGWPVLLARQFRDVLVLVLLAAVAISLLIGDRVDAVAIAAIVVLNAALGFVQEWRAERALEALRRMLAPNCEALRDGRWQTVNRRDLVPGDVVNLQRGDRAPADLRLVETADLQAGEAALTGEAAAVLKHPDPVAADTDLAARSNMAWMGTDIVSGHGTGIVVATGMRSEFGRIAGLTQAMGQGGTPLQRKLSRLGRRLGLVAVGLAGLISVSGWLLGRPWSEMALTGVSLAVAVVPEGLPAVVTVVLALGAAAMVRRQALVRRLQATEALGAATVVCTDKTGTLTRGEMRVTGIWLAAGAVSVEGDDGRRGGFREDGHALDPATRSDLMAALRAGNACNHARLEENGEDWTATGSPTEAALRLAAAKAGLVVAPITPWLAEFPFDSDRKRMSVIVERGAGRVLYMKGAPEVVLERATRIRDGDAVRPIHDADRHGILAAYHAMAADGLRILAVAERELAPDDGMQEANRLEEGLTLLGLFAISDPPRAEARHAVGLARAAGIRVIMITGDAAPTAAAIAGQLDLPDKLVLTHAEFSALDDTQLVASLQQGAVLARATPEDKMRVVRLLQAQGEIVAMTGDGINDAPALKQADIGVAMGVRGTDVAKNAADIVLLDDNFASIVAAIGEGRRQFANIQKFVRYLLSSNFGEVLAVAIALLAGAPMILLPVQILWMNLVTDGFSALALGMEKGEPDLMHRPPRPPSGGVLDRRGLLLIATLGGYIGLATLALFAWYLSSPDTAARAQTMAFTAMIVMEKFNVLNFRTLREPMTRIGVVSNRVLIAAISITLLVQVLAVYLPGLQHVLHTVPLTLSDWGVILVAGLPVFLVPEGIKLALYHRRRRRAGQAV